MGTLKEAVEGALLDGEISVILEEVGGIVYHHRESPGSKALVTKNTKPHERPYRMTLFKTGANPQHTDFDSPEKAHQTAKQMGFHKVKTVGWKK